MTTTLCGPTQPKSDQTLTLTPSDAAGALDLGVINLLVNNFLDGNHSCYLADSRPLNVRYVVNDAGDALLPGLAVNGSGSVSNSQCPLNGVGTSAVANGNR